MKLRPMPKDVKRTAVTLCIIWGFIVITQGMWGRAAYDQLDPIPLTPPSTASK